ncbi:MAG: bifunctional serine/threonine-protein kinase/formylglycine-generating enzyme family protein [Myxococcota bacterium]
MLTNGTLLEDRYLVLDHIGTGTFARRYRARHVTLQTSHVLQVLEPPYADAAEVRARFVAEGRIQAGLRHPHLVAVTDVLTTPVAAVVTDVVAGPTLRAHLTALARPLDHAEMLALVLPVLDAVAAAHAAGIVHRALAPEHVILATDAQGRPCPMVTDFGLARVLEGTTPTTAHRHADLAREAGLLQYRSPEQVRGDDDVGPATDIYALGVMVYEQLTGQLPYESGGESADAFDTRRDILSGTWWPPEMLVPDLAPEVGALLRRALALSPEARFRDCASLRTALVEAGGAPVVEAPVVEAAVPDDDVTDPGRPARPVVSPAPVVPSLPPVPPVAAPKVDPPVSARPPPAARSPFPVALLAVGALGLVAAAALAYVLWPAPPSVSADPVAAGSAATSPVASTGESVAAIPSAPAADLAVRYPMVLLAPRRFTMGADPSEPGRWKDEIAHPVQLTRSVLVGAHEVDQALWAELMGTNPSAQAAPTHPVGGVSWRDAVEFCNRLSQREGLVPAYVVGASVTWEPGADGFRLPTEAEWEAAARAGAADPFAGAGGAGPKRLADVAWYDQNAGGATHPVGALAANHLGLFDMSGNVSEWTWDWYGDYPVDVAVDPAGPDRGESRVHRGGSWDAAERTQRVAYRRAALPETRSPSIGLRVVRTVSREAPADR